MPEAAPRPPGRFRKLLRYGLYTLGAVTLLVAALLTYLAATFDPNDYRQRVIEIVREKTGRTLEIHGDIGLSFWPDIAVQLGSLSLSERDGIERFASIAGARARLEIGSLLERRLVASELLIDGAAVTLVRNADGRLNIDDLLRGDGETPQFDIGGVAVTRSALTFRDVATGRQYRFTDIALKIGRVAAKAESPLEVAFNAHDAADTFAAAVKLTGRLRLDTATKRYGLSQATLDVAGRAAGLDDAKLRARGELAVDLAMSRVSVGRLELALDAERGATERVTITAATNELLHAAGEVVARDVDVTVAARGAAGTTDVKLALPTLLRRADAITAPSSAVTVKVVRGVHVLEAQASTPLEVSIAAREIVLKGVSAEVVVSGPRTSRGGIRGALKGDVKVDADPAAVHVQLAGRIDESNVKAHVAAAGFAAPVYTFAVAVDRLNLDRYVPSDKAPARTRPDATPAESLLAPLAEMPASGTLTVGVLTAAGARASNVKVVLK